MDDTDVSTLQVTSSIIEDKYRIEAILITPGDLPSAIFVYSNTGTTELGEFQGVCTMKEYTSLQTFTGEVVPVFGNKFLKHTQAILLVELTEDVDQVIETLKANVVSFGVLFRGSQDILRTYTV